VSNRSGSTSKSDKESGADVVELVPTSTIDRTERSRKEDSRSSAGYRSVRLARQQQKQSVDSLPRQGEGDSPARPAILCEGADRFLVTDGNPSRQEQDDRTGRNKEATKKSYDSNADLTASHQPAEFLAETETMAKTSPAPRAIVGPTYQAAQCYQIFQVERVAVVLFWKLNKIDDWMSPLLGAACKEFLAHRKLKTFLFDLSQVEEMSTAAISTLVRFKNTLNHLDGTMHMVAGPKLRLQLERTLIERLIDVQDNIYRFVGSEIQFDQIPKIKVAPNKFRPSCLLRKLLAR
jgi:anti-anti-sigma regulatory factor